MYQACLEFKQIDVYLDSLSLRLSFQFQSELQVWICSSLLVNELEQ